MQNNTLQIEYISFKDLSELSSEYQNLVSKANEALLRAYSPYSGFNVGSAILLDNGTIVEGSNQENAAYPSGLCAERVALFYAGSQYPNNKIKAIAIVGKNTKKPKNNDIISPCGACRQVMIETEYRQKEPVSVILTSQNGCGLIFKSIEQLMPFSFELLKNH